MLGDGPVGVIDVPVYRRRLLWLGKRVLSDENFVEEMVFAAGYSPRQAPNCVQLTLEKGDAKKWLCKQIAITSGTGPNVLLVVLDPSGRPVFMK